MAAVHDARRMPCSASPYPSPRAGASLRSSTRCRPHRRVSAQTRARRTGGHRGDAARPAGRADSSRNRGWSCDSPSSWRPSSPPLPPDTSPQTGPSSAPAESRADRSRGWMPRRARSAGRCGRSCRILPMQTCSTSERSTAASGRRQMRRRRPRRGPHSGTGSHRSRSVRWLSTSPILADGAESFTAVASTSDLPVAVIAAGAANAPGEGALLAGGASRK